MDARGKVGGQRPVRIGEPRAGVGVVADRGGGRLVHLDPAASGVGQVDDLAADRLDRATARERALDDRLDQPAGAFRGGAPARDEVLADRPAAIGERLEPVLDLDGQGGVEHGLGRRVVGERRAWQRAEERREHRRRPAIRPVPPFR